MSQGRVRRRLSAILSVDVVGYGRLMAADEVGTHAALLDCQKSILDPSVSGHGGRVVKLMGDGALVEFQSVVDAVECGIDIQAGFSRRNVDLPQAKAILVRIGINLGDIIIDRGDIFGDGVNIAARLEAIADPGGICIAGSVYEQVKSKVDVKFEDLGEQTVKNIAEPVRVYQVKQAGSVTIPFATAASAVTVRPSIAILPLDNLSGDSDQRYFCDGVSEDLTTGLSRFDWLFVAARNAAFRYQGQPVDVKRVGRELGVRYVLEGSVRSADKRARVNVQLIETERQGHVWADRLDADMADPFEAQDDVVARIASTLGPEIMQAEVSNVLLKQNQDHTAWDRYLLALRGYFTMTKPALEEAITHLDKAIELEPDFVMSHGLLALCHGQMATHGWTRPAREGFRRALDLANKAIRMAPASPEANQALGCVLMYTGKAKDAVTSARRAIELNPYYAEGHAVLGHSLIMCGELEEGINACQTALKSTPRDFRGSWLLDAIGHGYFFRGEYEKAIDLSNRGLQSDPGLFGALVTLACANARLGRMDEAKRAIDQLLTDIPRYSLSAVRKNPMFVDPKLVDELIDSLRLAGLPE
ncbi:adenylate/guanylate cyclase domain-containing protein [Ruegeria arenilitoris]|uniref:adenylate/guanylate cyclase domain-containing protein n=1 Tax=Ruegeria arenilitoris TaxID=1173585 RepID=UPI0014806E37|nr:adenylate/guanylate cyclase domain-containing protein [Ruegeria arenilitoris]